jgi:hypothetical protein
MKSIQQYTIFDGSSVMQANFTAATTDIITSNSHGLKEGDVLVFTTSGTLPAGLSLLTEYQVKDVTTNTFKVNTLSTGVEADITGTGSGTHAFHLQGRKIFVGNCDFINISVFGNASVNSITLKAIGSNQETAPNFAGTLSATNMYDYIDIIDLEDASGIDGDTGITPGASEVRQFSANVDGLNWLSLAKTAWTAGNVTVKATLYYKY